MSEAIHKEVIMLTQNKESNNIIKKKQLSLLKYKVLLLLLSLTEGRKKGDTIYNKIAFKFHIS